MDDDGSEYKTSQDIQTGDEIIGALENKTLFDKYVFLSLRSTTEYTTTVILDKITALLQVFNNFMYLNTK